MNVLYVVVGAGIFFAIAYFTYGTFLDRKVFQLNEERETPAVSMEDGVDYVPAKKGMLMGQHFSAVAAAGPINGPILAGALFGWVPALLWVVIGSVFIGGIHDMGSLVVSIRHKAKSITEVIRINVSKRAWVLFMLFVWLALDYVIIALTDITASSFVGIVTMESGEKVAGGAIASSSILYLILPIIMGLCMRFLKLKEGLAVLIFLPLVGLSIWAGQYIPINLPVSDLYTAQKIWGILIIAYCLIASIVPVWLLLQPRGALGGLFHVCFPVLCRHRFDFRQLLHSVSRFHQSGAGFRNYFRLLVSHVSGSVHNGGLRSVLRLPCVYCLRNYQQATGPGK